MVNHSAFELVRGKELMTSKVGVKEEERHHQTHHGNLDSPVVFELVHLGVLILADHDHARVACQTIHIEKARACISPHLNCAITQKTKQEYLKA